MEPKPHGGVDTHSTYISPFTPPHRGRRGGKARYHPPRSLEKQLGTSVPLEATGARTGGHGHPPHWTPPHRTEKLKRKRTHVRGLGAVQERAGKRGLWVSGGAQWHEGAMRQGEGPTYEEPRHHEARCAVLSRPPPTPTHQHRQRRALRMGTRGVSPSRGRVQCVGRVESMTQRGHPTERPSAPSAEGGPTRECRCTRAKRGGPPRSDAVP